MSRVIRVIVEGGSTGRTADGDFRRGWSKFLGELRTAAIENGFQKLNIVRGLGRSRSFKIFQNSPRTYPGDLCVLLVDAETAAPKNQSVWQVVKARKGDGWDRPKWATDRHLYLMAHMAETWLLTDQAALATFFKRGFNSKNLPTTNLEERTKNDIEKALLEATKKCQRGPYTHGDAHRVIELVSPTKVRGLYHGNRLFEEFVKLVSDAA